MTGYQGRNRGGVLLTEKELSQYRKIKREAEDLEQRIDKLYEKELDTGYGTVKASSKEFPFCEYRIGVWVEDPEQVDDRDKLIKIYSDRLEKGRKEILRIEQFISSIPDSELRQIFELRYVDGKKVREIGKELNMDRSTVGKKISKYINFPPIPQIKMIQ